MMFQKKQANGSIYNIYLKFGKTVEDTENYKKVEFECNGQNFSVYTIKKPVKKSTIVHLTEDGTIYREQLLPFGHIMLPSRVKTSILKPVRLKDEVIIVLFKGKPNFIGLDSGMFASVTNKNKSKSSILVMSEANFKSYND